MDAFTINGAIHIYMPYICQRREAHNYREPCIHGTQQSQLSKKQCQKNTLLETEVLTLSGRRTHIALPSCIYH